MESPPSLLRGQKKVTFRDGGKKSDMESVSTKFKNNELAKVPIE